MNKEQSEALFREHAVFMNGQDVIYDYKITELFGEEMSRWVFSAMGVDNFLKPADHYGSWNDRNAHYFTMKGFMLIVSQYNYLVACELSGKSIWAELRRARAAEFEARYAEEQRKYEERKAKRAASRKAKQDNAISSANVISSAIK